MYSTVLRGNSFERYFSLKGIEIDPIYEEKIDAYNTIVIDSSFQYDITLSFPKYMFNVIKIINSYTIGKRDKVFRYLNDEFYNRKFDKDIYKDFAILLRKEKYLKSNLPILGENNNIRIIQLRTEDIGETSVEFGYKQAQYDKLRITIFNETVLPYIKQFVL